MIAARAFAKRCITEIGAVVSARELEICAFPRLVTQSRGLIAEADAAAAGAVPLTLQEALAKGTVKVRETGSVNALTVENTGTDEVSAVRIDSLTQLPGAGFEFLEDRSRREGVRKVVPES